jgi:hypothetical protein
MKQKYPTSPKTINQIHFDPDYLRFIQTIRIARIRHIGKLGATAIYPHEVKSYTKTQIKRYINQLTTDKLISSKPGEKHSMMPACPKTHHLNVQPAYIVNCLATHEELDSYCYSLIWLRD